MTAIPFDTLKFVERLTSAGVPEPQAKAQAEALVEAMGGMELATKADIAAVRGDMREMEQRLNARIEAVKADMIKWVAGLLLAQAALVATLVKLL